MKHLRAMLVILIALFVVILAVENYQAMSTKVNFRIDLAFWQWESAPMSVYFVVVIAFLVGLLLMGLYGMTERFRLKRRIKALQKEAKQKDEELNSLRNLPVTSEAVGPEDEPLTEAKA